MSPIFSHTFEHQCAVELWQFADLTFAVTYGKETHERIGYAEASMKLGQCLMHAAQCAGLIEERDTRATYTPGIGWQFVNATGCHGSFETEEQALTAALEQTP